MTLNQLSEAHNVALSTTDRPDTMDTKANKRVREAAERERARGADVSYGWPTSRCFPRTFNEAFKDAPENAQWWYPPEQRTRDKVFFWLSVALWTALAIYLWKTK